MAIDTGCEYEAIKPDDKRYPYFENGCDIGHTIQVQSNISKPIVIRDRNGLSYNVPPRYTGGVMRNDITVMMVYTVKNDVNVNMPVEYIEGCEELKKVYEAFSDTKYHQDKMQNRYTIRVTYKFTHDYILSHGGVLYIPGADIVLSILPESDTGRHPYDVISLRDTVAKDIKEDYNNVCVRGLRLVDSLNQLGTMYTNINGEIYRVEPDRSINEDNDDTDTSSVKDGLYILGDEPVKRNSEKRGNAKGYRSTYISIDKLIKEPNKYNLYATRQDARNMGNKQLESAQNALEVQIDKVEGLNKEVSELKQQIDNLKRQSKHQSNDNMWKGFMDIPKILAAVVTFVKMLK